MNALLFLLSISIDFKDAQDIGMGVKRVENKEIVCYQFPITATSVDWQCVWKKSNEIVEVQGLTHDSREGKHR